MVKPLTQKMISGNKKKSDNEQINATALHCELEIIEKCLKIALEGCNK